jgi:murein DD-endopeptidase MepM/ murein hydrolase activator NlpD
VLFSGWTYDDGNVIILSHGGGVITVYKHNSSLLKSVGSMTKRGDVIALVGNTGRTSKGPHVHFEALKDGVPHDPLQFLLRAKTTL